MKTVQALRARWQAQPIDPTKPPLKLPSDLVKIGLAMQEEHRVTWNYQLPAGLYNAIEQRQPARPQENQSAANMEAHATGIRP